MPLTSLFLALSLLLATNLATQELPPSQSPSEKPSNPSPAQEKGSGAVEFGRLLVQTDSGAVFFGLLTEPAGTNVILEFSPDLRSWQENVPVLGLNAPPPPPPIALIDRLGRSPGQNLRIIPLDTRGFSNGFCRSKVMTVTNPAARDGGSTNRTVSVKP